MKDSAARFCQGFVSIRVIKWRTVLFLLFVGPIVASGCAKSIVGGSDGESHFLVACASGCKNGYSCICGVCTESCGADKSCAELAPTALCVEVQTAQQCRSGDDDVFGFCDVTCESSEDCSVLGADYACRAGFCRNASREWELMESDTSESLTAIWGFDDDDIWVAGETLLLHYDGDAWEVAFENLSFRDLWGSAPDDIWAIGSLGTETESGYEEGIFHYDGKNWEHYDMGEEEPANGFTAIWGTSADNVYAFRVAEGWWPLPLHWDGRSWKEHDAEIVKDDEEDEEGSIFSWETEIAGNSPDNIIVADWGGLVHFDGTQWTILESTLIVTCQGANAAWALSNGDFFVGIGDCGIYRYSDRSKSIELNVSQESDSEQIITFSGMWGLSDTDIFTIGTQLRRNVTDDGWDVIASSIWRFDGQSWSEDDVGDLAVRLYGIWGSPTGELWIVGDEGTILRRRP